MLSLFCTSIDFDVMFRLELFVLCACPFNSILCCLSVVDFTCALTCFYVSSLVVTSTCLCLCEVVSFVSHSCLSICLRRFFVAFNWFSVTPIYINYTVRPVTVPYLYRTVAYRYIIRHMSRKVYDAAYGVLESYVYHGIVRH